MCIKFIVSRDLRKYSLYEHEKEYFLNYYLVNLLGDNPEYLLITHIFLNYLFLKKVCFLYLYYNIHNRIYNKLRENILHLE